VVKVLAGNSQGFPDIDNWISYRTPVSNINGKTSSGNWRLFKIHVKQNNVCHFHPRVYAISGFACKLLYKPNAKKRGKIFMYKKNNDR
jgi:hypothetical protein